MTGLTADERRDIAERHKRVPEYPQPGARIVCIKCGRHCDVARLLDALDAAEKRVKHYEDFVIPQWKAEEEDWHRQIGAAEKERDEAREVIETVRAAAVDLSLDPRASTQVIGIAVGFLALLPAPDGATRQDGE